MLDLHQTYKSLITKAKEKGFDIEELDLGDQHPTPLLALSKATTEKGAPTIYLSSGIHGDEPAGPLALERLFGETFFDNSAHWLICPMLNPYGLANNCRENPEGIDLNRDYRSKATKEVKAHTNWMEPRVKGIDLSIGLHEDWEAKGFYLYDERMELPAELTNGIMEAVSQICPIEMAETIDGLSAKNGIIKPSMGEGLSFFDSMHEWPEAFYLLTEKLHPHYTFESPTEPTIANRVETHCAATRKAVEGYFAMRKG